MLGIILTGHGGFASGMYEAAVQIVGKQEQFVAINFPDGMSTDEFEIQLREALMSVDQGDGVIFLTDILGGSPFRLAAMLSFASNKAEVITGTNMPLLLEMLLERENLDVENFRKLAILSAKNGVTSLHDQGVKAPKDHEELQDGI